MKTSHIYDARVSLISQQLLDQGTKFGYCSQNVLSCFEACLKPILSCVSLTLGSKGFLFRMSSLPRFAWYFLRFSTETSETHCGKLISPGKLPWLFALLYPWGGLHWNVIAPSSVSLNLKMSVDSETQLLVTSALKGFLLHLMHNGLSLYNALLQARCRKP